MKNLCTVFGLFFLFTFSAFAQEAKQEDPRVLAKKELYELSKVINLENQTATSLNDLLIYKHETLSRYPERKEELAKIMEGKLKGTLTPDQYAKVSTNKILFKDLLY